MKGEKIRPIYPDFAISFDNEDTLYLIELKVGGDPSKLVKGIQEDRNKYELLKEKGNKLCRKRDLLYWRLVE